MAVTLVLGGARSGKSRFAEKLALNCGKKPLYIATAQAHDNEMRQRIKLHQQRRETEWQTIEAPLDLVGVLEEMSDTDNCLLVDCLTLWLTNLLLDGRDIVVKQAALLAFLAKTGNDIILVASEVGLGIVPDNALARQFRDHAGDLNQTIAVVAQKVYLVAAGLPLTLKG